MTLEDFLRDVAREYDALPVVGFHVPYAQLKKELAAQFELLHAYVAIQFVNDDPYRDSAKMFEDIEYCHSLFVYRTAYLPSGHPFTETHEPTGECYNTIFRAVHDGLAHYPKRHNFGMLGEFLAFRAHCRLLSPLAQWAVATETLGQNAWYHFAPGRIGPKTFASQKYALLSRATVDRALTEDFD